MYTGATRDVVIMHNDYYSQDNNNIIINFTCTLLLMSLAIGMFTYYDPARQTKIARTTLNNSIII